MSFNAPRRNKNRNINNSNNANYGLGPGGPKLDKQNRMKNLNDKNQGSNRYEGVYSNPDFMYANTSLIGTLANIVHKDGYIYEGIFNTFSSDFEIVLNTVSKVVPKAENTNSISPNVGSLLASLSAKNEFLDTVIFKLQDIVMMTIPNVNLDFAIKGNFTDTEISKFNPSVLAKEKDLVPWDGGYEDGEQINDMVLNDDATGWNADDMFKLNEVKYNLSSTYTEAMEGYTVALDKNAEDYEQREAEATRIAKLIENDVASKDRLAKEDGDEEDKFSAVHRPIIETTPSPNVNKPNYQSNNTTSINQHSRHDNLNNNMMNINRNRNKNQNLSGGNNSYNNQSLSRSKNQSLNSSGGNLQQQSNYYSNRSNNNGPLGSIHNRQINSRLDQPHNHELDKDQTSHHRLDNRDSRQLIHNNEQQLNSNTSGSQRNSHNNNNNNSNNQRRPNLNTQNLQKREETTHDLKKFSSGFKLAINQQPQGNSQQLDNKIKELTKDVKQLNINKQININKQHNDPKEQQQINKNDQKSSSNNSKNLKDEDNSQQINKPVNKPLIDKPPSKDKSPTGNDKLNYNDQSKDKVNKQQQYKQQDATSKPVESPKSVEQQQQTTNEDNKIEESQKTSINNESLKSQTGNVESSTTSSQTSDSGKGSSNASTVEADKALKKPGLNPNAKEFVFNPKANPYTPKFIPNAYQPPANQLPTPNNMQQMPPSNANPQLAFPQPILPHAMQPAGLHPQAGQMPISQLNVQHHPNQQGSLIAPTVIHHHPGQQHQPALMNQAVQIAAHQAGHHHQTMLAFPPHPHPHLIPAASNVPHQFSNHQGIPHHHPQQSQYLIPAVPSPVSTANLPYGQPPPQPMPTGQNVNQPPPQNLNQQPNTISGNSNNNSTGGNQQPPNPRSTRNKAQYHQSNPNQRSNQPPSSQQQNMNQGANLNQSPSLNQQQVRNEYVVANPAVYPGQIHLNSFNPYQMPNQQINNAVQFSPHNPHHTRLIAPQSLNMVPGMTGMTYTTAAPDPAAIQQIYSMTNMSGVTQFVAVQAPNSTASVSSPVHMIQQQPGVLPPPASTPNQLNQAPSGQRTTSNNSNGGSNTSQQQIMIQQGNPQNVQVSYASPTMMPSFIIASPNLQHGHLANNANVNSQQTEPPQQPQQTSTTNSVQNPVVNSTNA